MNAAQPTVLIVDDEPAICWCLEQLFRSDNFQVESAADAEEGLRLASKSKPSLIILDVRLPGMSGLDSLPRFKQIVPDTPIIIITAFGDLQTAVQAIRQGAADYLTKPFGTEQVQRVYRSVLAAAHQARQAALNEPSDVTQYHLHARKQAVPGLVGRSAAMQEVYRQIAMVAESELSVLITGETGTGKELVAAAIHAHSKRARAPYLPIAPVALNPTLVESELFGHVRGAFTGAHDDRQGLFALANGGTVLLDEIGDLTPAVQVKLLRVLEQGVFTPVGDIKPRQCDVRILAATHRNLRMAIERHEFREDLYYRLATVEIRVPALRERLEDIEMLAQHFLSLAGHSLAHRPLSPDVLHELRHREWPGNVRELRNVVEHAAVMSRGGPVTLQHLPTAPLQETFTNSTSPATPPASLQSLIRDWVVNLPPAAADTEGNLMEQFLAEVEPSLLEAVLDRTGGNRAAAAQWLGIHRGTLRERLRRYGFDS
jgi:two-component system nitrogen regulation response regulator GlnG